MKNNGNRHDSLAIIGNGFDLAHDYKTSYSNFTSATGEHLFSEYKGYIATYCGDDIEWNNFEKQVESLTGAFYQKVISEEQDEDTIKQFNKVFQTIKDRLIEYLKKETASKPFHKIESISKRLAKSTIGLNFNYTDTAQNYISDIIHVHGSIQENEIVLGYDPPDPFCLASYENRKWFKQICRERLGFIRDIEEKLHIHSSDKLHRELCEDYEQIQRLENSGKGFDTEDIATLKHADFFNEYMLTRCNNDIFLQRNVSLDNIHEVFVLGHSIKSDETYLKEVLNRCGHLTQVVIFSYSGESQEEWETKVQFFSPYCAHIEKAMY